MGPPKIWLGMWMAMDALRHGCLILGDPGTGKSLILKAFRMSLARAMEKYPELILRIVDFDTKSDLYDIHAAFPDDCPIFDLDPFISGDVYQLMDEIDDPRDLRELAAALVELSSNDTQRYFPMSARMVCAQLLTRHWLVCPDVVNPADLVRSCNSPDNMRRVARSHPSTRGLLPMLQDNESGLGVMGTLATAIDQVAMAAALYLTNTKGRKVSSRTLLQLARCIIKLPFNLRSRETLGPLTRLFLMQAQMRVLSAVEKDSYTLLILDELSLLPGGVDLTPVTVFGREPGMCPIGSFQSIATTAKTFGRQNLEAAIATLKTIICFRLSDPQDAEAAAKRFGSFEGIVRDHSGTDAGAARAFADGLNQRGGSTSSGSWADRSQTVQNVTPGMIQALQVPSPGYPYLEFFMQAVGARPAFFRIPIKDITNEFFRDLKPVAPPPPRDPKDMVLPPWDDDDLKRLGLD